MLQYKTTLLVIVTLLFFGCSSQIPLTGIGMYDFDYEGEQFGIISSATATNGNGNMLVQKQEDRITMRAMDFDKDGSIDKVIQGSASIEQADIIYKAGISLAQNQNKFMAFEHERMYSTTGPGNFQTYIVQTYITTGKDTYNKFIIVNQNSRDKIVLIDDNADGQLDMDAPDNDYQNLYTHILKSGLREGKIDMINNQYLVEKKHSRSLVVSQQ